ncbi:Phospholipase D beta 1 [Asimina triloba]
MENYGAYPYPYPPPATNSDHGIPPPSSHVYPYPAPHPYPSQPYPPPYHTHSGPLDPLTPPYHAHSGSFDGRPMHHSGPLFPTQPLYPTSASPYPNYPPPHSYNLSPADLRYHGSPQYGSPYANPYPCYQPGPAPPDVSPSLRPLTRINSSPEYFRQDSSVSSSSVAPSGASSSSLYPIDNLMASMHLEDQSQKEQESTRLSSSSHSFDGHSFDGHFFDGHSFDSHSHLRPQTALIYRFPNHSFSGHTGSFSHPPPPGVMPPSPSSGSFHGQNLQIVPFQPGKASLKVLLLHGSLDIIIFEARNLPNMDMFSKTLKEMFGRTGTGSKVGSKIEDHIHGPNTMTSDPYVSIVMSKAVLGRTYVISNSENPVWHQHFYVPVAHYAAELVFVVKDSDVVGSQFIGSVAIPADQLSSGAKVEGYYPILNSSGKECNPGAVLLISVQYIPIEQQIMYHHGVGAGPDYFGVPGTYFPLRRGGRVTLYQDAHVPDGSLPELRLDNGMRYVHGKCWVDIFDAIRQARRLIYIAGWSVYHKVRLVRDGAYGSDSTLGDLLKTKSQEGVRVLLLVWDDPTSRKIWLLQTGGVMQTHDEETRRFFKHSSVQVILCPRVAGKRHSWAKQREVGVIYTHHQKTVIVDADAGNNKRKIIAFVGGLDLCDGRYDTPKHPIFKTLQTVHKDDYHNPTFPGTDPRGPREPWHDLHCKIDGPAAYDVLTNFEERWLKASKPHGIQRLKKSLYDDSLLKLDRISDVLGMHDAPFLSENDPEVWHVQVFRSIDSNSVKGFPKDPKHATSKNLCCGKNVLIDMSIHSAYVKAIRAAQHFIYIENQYFLGSSYNWSKYNDLGANNLIPMEIALKITSKIKANERFSAYIVIPMWPEGDPTGVPTQRILFWQNKTMQMMYDMIYKALEEAGLENTFTPQDYLNFFCLGNREAAIGSDASCESPAANTPQRHGHIT